MPHPRERSDSRDTKSRSYNRLFSRFAEKTSMQGIPYIYLARFWWSRLIWVILTLAAMGAMVAHLYYLIEQFYMWPVQTKLSLGFDNQPLPAITICNFNALKKSSLDMLPADLAGFKRFVNFLDPDNLSPAYAQGVAGKRRRKRGFIDDDNFFNISMYDDDYRNYDDDYLYQDYEGIGTNENEDTGFENIYRQLYMEIPRAFRRSHGHNITSMMISCSFNGRDCYPQNFTLFQTSEYGNCWTLDSSKLIVRTPGPGGGFSITLFLENHEFLEGITRGTGIRIMLHDRSSLPFPFTLGQFVAAGAETDIALRRVIIKRIDDPHGDCTTGADFEASYKTKYTRTACNKMCKIRRLYQACTCYDADDEEYVIRYGLTSAHPCHSEEEEKCFSRFKVQLRQRKTDCGECKNPCTEIQFVKSVSSRNWPSEKFASVLVEHICDNYQSVCSNLTGSSTSWLLSQHFLKLNIYYEDLNYEEIEETPEIEVVQFLSDVGGAIGLWIGLSMLAVCEVFQLIVELIQYTAHKCRSKEELNESRARRKATQLEKYRIPQRGHLEDGDVNYRNTTFSDRRFPVQPYGYYPGHNKTAY